MSGSLNDVQLRAVRKTEGAVLVFAGAGSGKTRVITHRIAYLINDLKIPPEKILAVTFTNKAAKEMKERVEALLDINMDTSELTISTFHSLGLRILKKEAEKIDYPSTFTIFSPYEQTELMKKVMEQQNISSERFSARMILSAISKLKNNPDLFDSPEFLISNINFATARKLVTPYEEAMRTMAALDFDDLIVKPVNLLKSNKDVLKKYSEKYQYIMVDEYQDTNIAQFELINLLASHHGNICVVGDDDQSIYSWRGARVENILNFESSFPDCTVIKLEQNYRSVKEIVESANKLISYNRVRADKKSFSSIEAKEKEGIKVIEVSSERDEADYVARTISGWLTSGIRPNNIAIIIRANSQSKPFEISLNQYGIPYQIIGGNKFFENKEIKDIIAYLRVLLNPNDEISLRRIINYPSRGIGNATIDKLIKTSGSVGILPSSFLKNLNSYGGIFKQEQLSALENFNNLLNNLNEKLKIFDAVKFSTYLIDAINIENEVKKSSENETVAKIRIDNIRAFVDAVATDPNKDSSRTARSFFYEFINSITLIQNGEEKEKSNSVNIITAHSAKGLEFERVFLTGYYQGGFPNHMAIEELNIDEERRLAYVAMTRAKKFLMITVPGSYSFRGNHKDAENSIFIKEAGLDSEKYTGKPPITEPGRFFDALLKKSSEKD